ncbi:MAG: cytochrome c3 family protein, partial [Phycisphaerae bacterium]
MLIPHLIGIAAAVVGQSSNLTYSTTYTDGLSHPARLAATAGGGLYVTDQPAAQVVELDAAGAAVNTYPIPEKPIGIAVHPLGDVFISRADGHVGRYDASFVLQEVLDPAPATLVAPNGLAVHSITGELYVVDSAEGQILVFADDVVTGWSLARAWGISGFGTAELMTPQALALDTALDLVIVADTDNFRGHVFDTAGMFVRRFGYRTSYVGMDSVAWVARTAGVAVDSCSNMYLSDALMGTVRVFDSMGVDLHLPNPPIGYGANPGELRVPSGVLISGGKLYVASTYNATVEVFDLSCTSGGARDGGQPINALSDADLWPGEKKSRKRSLKSSGSSHVDRSAEIPGFSGGFDLNQDGSVDSADLLIAVETYGPIVVDEFLADAGASASHPSLAPPHIIDMPNRCGRCHSMHGLPSGMLTAAGQENLCLSCHTAAGVAMGMPIEGSDRASSHPWGVPASSVDVPGPAPGSELALHLDGGNIRCGTCHDPHETFEATDPPYYADLPYLRTTRRNIDLCGECHEEYGEWLQAGHADEEAEAFVHYDWSLPNRAACRKCHSGNGYIDFSNDVPESERRGDFRVHD